MVMAPPENHQANRNVRFGPLGPRLEHHLEMSRLIPNAQLAVIPGAGRFVLDANPGKLLPIIATFLDEPTSSAPWVARDRCLPRRSRRVQAAGVARHLCRAFAFKRLFSTSFGSTTHSQSTTR